MMQFHPHGCFTIHPPVARFGENTIDIACFYSSDPYKFTETFSFVFPFKISLEDKTFRKLLELVAIAAAPSYYKVTRAYKLEIDFETTQETKRWINGLLDQGLGEFRYRNNFRDRNGDPEIIIPEILSPDKESRVNLEDGIFGEITRCLVPIGGGKDSITTLEILRRANIDVVGFEVGDFHAIEETAREAEIDLIRVTRKLDTALFELNSKGAPNGHVPVTALVSTLACVAAHASGISAVAMSNEASADEDTVNNVEIKGEVIHANHQWSKSSQAEELLMRAISSLEIQIAYFSALRSLSELEIFSLFSTMKNFHSIFTSCNRSFHIDESKRYENWCGQCDKCRFVFLGLCAFCDVEYVSKIFSHNLFDDENNIEGFMALFDPNAKPFECVGTLSESYVLAKMAFRQQSVEETKFGVRFRQYRDEIEHHGSKLNMKHRSRAQYVNIPKVIIDATNDLTIEVYSARVRDLLAKRSIACIGLGRDTAGFIRYLRNVGIESLVTIFMPDDELDKAKALGENLELDLSNIKFESSRSEINQDLVLVSPGISKYDQKIKTLGDRVSTPLSLWLEWNLRLLPNTTFVGVTGTKGKSTVSSMLHEVLDNSILAGNIGTSVGSIGIGDLLSAEYVVLEISSFQSSYLTCSPDVVVVTSLFDCHIDWHVTPENYRRDKLNLMMHDPSFVFVSGSFQDDEVFKKLASGPIEIIPYDKTKSLQYNNEVLVRRVATAICGEDAEEMQRIDSVLEEFSGLKYRKEVVGIKNGVTYISDVLSTAPDASIMAVDDIKLQYPNATIYLLFGGAYRNVDLGNLIDGLNERSNFVVTIALPDTGHMAEESLSRVIHAANLSDAVHIVSNKAANGDIVLLAPGAPSFHRYTDYTFLAREYEELVNSINE